MLLRLVTFEADHPVDALEVPLIGAEMRWHTVGARVHPLHEPTRLVETFTRGHHQELGGTLDHLLP